MSALILFNFAWNQAPIVGWNSAQVIATLIAGVIVFFGFLWTEYRYAVNPLLPLDAFNADVGYVLTALACGWAMFGVWSLYVVLVLENIRGLSPLRAATWLLPVLITGLIASVITGFLLGPAKFTPPVVMTIALCAFLTGITIFATAPVDQIYWAQTFVSIVVVRKLPPLSTLDSDETPELRSEFRRTPFRKPFKINCHKDGVPNVLTM